MNAPHGSAEDEVDKYHVVVSGSLGTSGSRVLKHGDSFAVFNRFGDIQSVGFGEQGLYHDGTRFLSRMRLRLGNTHFLLLSSTVLQNNLLLAVDLTNPDLYHEHDPSTLAVPYGTLHVFRSKFLRDDTCYERLLVSNYGSKSVNAVLRMDFAADFVDVFEVRGMKRDARGKMLPSSISPTSIELAYLGLDQIGRRTRIEFAPPPTSLSEREVVFDLHLEAKQSKEIYIWTSCLQGEERRPVISYESAYGEAKSVIRQLDEEECSIHTSNTQFNDWLNRSQADLRMMTTETMYGHYPYAGVPWFSTPFGRDGIWTALQALWVNPRMAAGVLRFLAANQAQGIDPENDAEPGKILHEMRSGEMAALREIPFGKYYGSVDSTPLFVMLAARYYENTGDRELIETIWPNIVAALEWMDRHGDVDGDGFVEYGRRSKDGLVQQGWKDSFDSVFHHDGTMAEAPIAICEVQGYAYAARVGAALLARALGHNVISEQQELLARELRARFDAAYWCDELDAFALALDGKKRACRVRTSNAGHCLYTGIALPNRAERLSKLLLGPEMFSGWGIRTLSTHEARYNPMSYHNGSIWPHDNAVVAAGLARYGHKAEAVKVLTALFDASLFVDLHRLPELFCGFVRRESEGPTLYPVACSPQAWASAAPFLLLESVLGLRIDAVQQRVTFEHPMLPTFLEDVVIKNLRVGDARVDLRLHRYPDDVGSNVLRKLGTVEVVMVK